MDFNKVTEFILPCIMRPCCLMDCNDEERKKRIGEYTRPNTFEILYRNLKLGEVGYVPIVGDEIFGYTVWEVDYYHRYAYVTD